MPQWNLWNRSSLVAVENVKLCSGVSPRSRTHHHHPLKHINNNSIVRWLGELELCPSTAQQNVWLGRQFRLANDWQLIQIKSSRQCCPKLFPGDDDAVQSVLCSPPWEYRAVVFQTSFHAPSAGGHPSIHPPTSLTEPTRQLNHRGPSLQVHVNKPTQYFN